MSRPTTRFLFSLGISSSAACVRAARARRHAHREAVGIAEVDVFEPALDLAHGVRIGADEAGESVGDIAGRSRARASASVPLASRSCQAWRALSDDALGALGRAAPAHVANSA